MVAAGSPIHISRNRLGPESIQILWWKSELVSFFMTCDIRRLVLISNPLAALAIIMEPKIQLEPLGGYR